MNVEYNSDYSAAKYPNVVRNLFMKLSTLYLSAAATALLTASVFIVTTVAQAPQAPAAGTASTPPPQARPNRAPTNLQVLPKDTCNACHTEDTKNLNPNGKSRLLCADDSKPEKNTARTMFKLTGTINQCVGKIGSTGTQVSCGTCHRGHLTPEAFAASPVAELRPPQATPTAGTTPEK